MAPDARPQTRRGKDEDHHARHSPVLPQMRAPNHDAADPGPPSEEQKKCQRLLREFFRFHNSDIDFEIHRIMNHQRRVGIVTSTVICRLRSTRP